MKSVIELFYSVMSNLNIVDGVMAFIITTALPFRYFYLRPLRSNFIPIQEFMHRQWSVLYLSLTLQVLI